MTDIPASTRKVEVERPNTESGREAGTAPTDNAWSFGYSRELRIFGPLTPPIDGNQRRPQPNSEPMVTGDFRIPQAWRHLAPRTVRRPSFGKRGFSALYQWEGVVDEVNGDGFRARLTPTDQEEAGQASVEYVDFRFDDLYDEGDRELVAEGAVFYWTVGKIRTRAGNLLNTSLVRFRRLPSPTPSQSRKAAREAELLLEDLGSDASN